MLRMVYSPHIIRNGVSRLLCSQTEEQQDQQQQEQEKKPSRPAWFICAPRNPAKSATPASDPRKSASRNATKSDS